MEDFRNVLIFIVGILWGILTSFVGFLCSIFWLLLGVLILIFDVVKCFITRKKVNSSKTTESDNNGARQFKLNADKQHSASQRLFPKWWKRFTSIPKSCMISLACGYLICLLSAYTYTGISPNDLDVFIFSLSLVQLLSFLLILPISLKLIAKDRDRMILRICYIPILSYIGLLEVIELCSNAIPGCSYHDIGYLLFFKVIICFGMINVLFKDDDSNLDSSMIRSLILKHYPVMALSFIIVAFIPFGIQIPSFIDEKLDAYSYKSRGESAQTVVDTILAENVSAENNRKVKSPSLSFKKLNLSMNFDLVDELIQEEISNGEYKLTIEKSYSLFDTVHVYTEKPKKIYDRYLESYTQTNNCGIEDYFSNSVEEYSNNQHFIKGGLKSFKSVLQKEDVTIYLFENEDKLSAIYIAKKYSYGENALDLKSLVELYRSKYGEAERFVKYNEVSNVATPDEEHYYWQFQNGLIYISKYCILYVENSFLDLLNRSHERYLSNQAAARENSRLEMIEKKKRMKIEAMEKARRDSLQKVRERQKTLEDI